MTQSRDERSSPTNIFRALGGVTKAAQKLGISVGAVKDWRTHGIPPHFHKKVIQAAAKVGVIVDAAVLRRAWKTPTTAKEIIVALGGRIEVARILGTTKNAVSNWYVAGIPPRHHVRLFQEAARLGLTFITLDLLTKTHTPGAVNKTQSTIRERCVTCGRTVIVPCTPRHSEETNTHAAAQ